MFWHFLPPWQLPRHRWSHSSTSKWSPPKKYAKARSAKPSSKLLKWKLEAAAQTLGCAKLHTLNDGGCRCGRVVGGGGWTMVKQLLTYPLPVVKQRQSAAPEFHLKQRKSSMFETTHVISHHDIDSDAVHQYIAFESGSTASFYKIPILPFLFSQCIQRVSPQRSTPQRCTLAGAPQYLLHIMHFSKSCCEHHSWSCPDASGKLAVMHH